jgi:hypothetical protein
MISNVKNVDIERAFDIEFFDIECYARYRTSDTRYRGAKVPDVGYGSLAAYDRHMQVTVYDVI